MQCNQNLIMFLYFEFMFLTFSLSIAFTFAFDPFVSKSSICDISVCSPAVSKCNEFLIVCPYILRSKLFFLSSSPNISWSNYILMLFSYSFACNFLFSSRYVLYFNEALLTAFIISMLISTWWAFDLLDTMKLLIMRRETSEISFTEHITVNAETPLNWCLPMT